jgi:major intracellular serine protease
MASDNSDKKDWGFIDFKIDELWKLSKGSGITVAVLDSGLNYHLDDFKDNGNIFFYNAITGSDKKDDFLDDATGHGTECAGQLCAGGSTIFGVAPEIRLLVIKITNEAGGRETNAILKGLEKVIELGVDVISLSFTIPKSDANFEAIHEKIREADKKDIVVLASAGDSGGVKFPTDDYPAAFPECLSIGGIDRLRNRSKYSARSNLLDLMGPGEDMKSVAKAGSLISGTSFSTPFVAGIIAILKSVAKGKAINLPNSTLYDVLKKTADIKVSGTYSKIDYGSGIIDPLAALNLLDIK